MKKKKQKKKVSIRLAFHVEDVTPSEDAPTLCIHLSSHVYMYADKGYFYISVCVCVCLCASVRGHSCLERRQNEKFWLGCRGFCIQGRRTALIIKNGSSVTDSTDLQFNILVGKRGEYLTLICRRACSFTMDGGR